MKDAVAAADGLGNDLGAVAMAGGVGLGGVQQGIAGQHIPRRAVGHDADQVAGNGLDGHPDLGIRQPGAGLDGVVQQVEQDGAQGILVQMELGGQHHLHQGGNLLFLGLAQFVVEQIVQQDVAGLHLVQPGQIIPRHLFQILFQLLQLVLAYQGLDVKITVFQFVTLLAQLLLHLGGIAVLFQLGIALGQLHGHAVLFLIAVGDEKNVVVGHRQIGEKDAAADGQHVPGQPRHRVDEHKSQQHAEGKVQGGKH